MRIAPGDIVQASQRGRLFFARVTGVGPGASLSVVPLQRGVAVRRVGRTEVVDHWRHAAPPDGPSRDRDQLDLNEWIDD